MFLISEEPLYLGLVVEDHVAVGRNLHLRDLEQPPRAIAGWVDVEARAGAFEVLLFEVLLLVLVLRCDLPQAIQE